MKLFKPLLLLLFILIWVTPTATFAQTIDKNTTFWSAIVPAFRLSDKVVVYQEFNWRRSEFIKTWQQLVIRPSVAYTPMSGVSLTAGYTFANNYAYSVFDSPTIVPEHNIWEQVILAATYGKVKVTHRFRMEHRWIGIINSTGSEPFIDEYNFVNRFRYRLIGNILIFKLKEIPVSLTLFNELMITLDGKFRVSSVNQNWVVGLINFHLPKKSKISVGIQNQYFVRTGGDRIINTAMWLNFSREFDLRRKVGE